MKILVADPHPITRIGISKAILLNNTNHNINLLPQLLNGKNLMSVIKKEIPNVIFLELDLSHTKGIQTIKEIKKQFKSVKIFIYSHYPDEIYALSTIKFGASAYLCKTASIETLHLAFNRVMRGGIYLDDKLNDLLNNDYIETRFNSFKKLSTREVEVLNLLSNGIRNKEIAYKLEINEKTVSTYKARLFKKLKANNLAELINQSRLFNYT